MARRSRTRRLALFLGRTARENTSNEALATVTEASSGGGGGSSVDSATVASIARSTVNLDSATVISLSRANTLIDSAKVISLAQANVAGGGVDSSTVFSLIDSNYITARAPSGGGGGGIDSATVLSLVDSDYVTTRQTNTGGGSRKLTYAYDGTMKTYTGVKRTYITEGGTIGEADIFAATAPVGNPIVASLLKNGTSIATITLPAGANSDLNNTINQSVAAGDYLTMDITQVGTSTTGEDLIINLKFD